MKKKNFIIISLIIALILLSILIFIQINNLRDINKALHIQMEKLSSYQNLDTKQKDDTDSSVETNVSSSTYLTDTRKKEIQDRIEKYGKNENGIPVLMYHFFTIVLLVKEEKIIIF